MAALLAAFLNPETAAGRVESCRARLITEFAEPLIRIIVRRKMHADLKPAAVHVTDRDEHAHDAYGEAIVATCRALESWRIGKAQAPGSFLDYVAIIAYRACGRALDVSRSVEYLLTHQPGFALWPGADHLWVGGYREWQEEGRAPASASALDHLGRDPEGFAREGLRRRSPRKSLKNCNEVERLMALLDQTDAPIELGALAAAYQALEQAFPRIMRPVSLTPIGTEGDESYNMAEWNAGIDLEADIIDAEARRRDQRAFLDKMWGRAVQLPSQQRAALLLGLERSIFQSLVKDDIASFQEIAHTLDKTLEEFAEIWNRLPLNDKAIAHELDLSYGQVNDRRQSAYRTLAWHLRPYDRGALRRLWQAVLRLDPPRPAVYMLWARDGYGSSLLALLTRESLARRAELPERLHVPVTVLEGILDHLPLSFEQIAHLLAKTPQEVARLYMEVYDALRLQLSRDEPSNCTTYAVIHIQQQQE
jgi:hypothetical protein